MVSKKVQVKMELGLHLRPSGDMAEEASKYSCNVTMRANGRQVNGKSLISILSLGIRQDSVLEVECSGDDEEEALDAILSVIDSEEV